MGERTTRRLRTDCCRPRRGVPQSRTPIGARIGEARLPKGLLPRLWGAALLATMAAWGARWIVAGTHPVLQAVVILGIFGGVYLGATLAFGVREADDALARVRRLLRR